MIFSKIVIGQKSYGSGQRKQDFSRSLLVNVNRSRTKQTISSRSISHARVHIFTPRKCFTQAGREQNWISFTPVSSSAAMRFSKRSKNASSYPTSASRAISSSEIEMGGGAGVK